MDDAGGLVAAHASAALSPAARVQGYERSEVASLLAEAADRQAALQKAIDEARREALQPPRPLDVVPRADADRALDAAEARLAALQAELTDAHARLRHAQLREADVGHATLSPLVIPVAPQPAGPPPVGQPILAAAAPPAPAAAPPAWAEPTQAVPQVPAPQVAAPPVVVPQVVVQREPYSKATGLLQVITWSIVVAVVLIVLLAWFA